MLTLCPDLITDLYVFLDDNLDKLCTPHLGRPISMSDTEIITALVWNSLTLKQKTLKDIYNSLALYHKREFPRLPKYRAFLNRCHQITPQLIVLLTALLQTDSPIVFCDSTMIEVCKLVRADRHKVAKIIAEFGKNHQGWHYGFKLHAAVSPKGQLAGLALTPANVHDAQMLPAILNKKIKIAVGDGAYGASVMARYIFQKYGTIIVAPPHPKQKKKIIVWWQDRLLKMRPKIESVFDYLKEHLNLVSSFPRSISGYLLHYFRILLSYQILALS